MIRRNQNGGGGGGMGGGMGGRGGGMGGGMSRLDSMLSTGSIAGGQDIAGPVCMCRMIMIAEVSRANSNSNSYFISNHCLCWVPPKNRCSDT